MTPVHPLCYANHMQHFIAFLVKMSVQPCRIKIIGASSPRAQIRACLFLFLLLFLCPLALCSMLRFVRDIFPRHMYIPTEPLAVTPIHLTRSRASILHRSNLIA